MELTFKKVTALAIFALLGLAVGFAHAETPPIKIGLLQSYTGTAAHAGESSDRALKLFFSDHGDTVAGRKVEIIRRDTTGPAPDLVARQVQELIVREKVDILAGIDFTPNYFAAAPLSTKAKKPLLLMQPPTNDALENHPYTVRFGYIMAPTAQVLAQWAAKNGIKRVYNLVTDIKSGVDAEEVFNKTLATAGGKNVGAVRVPLKNPDYSAYLQRVKDTKPDAVFVFVPVGDAATGFIKAWQDAGLGSSGIKLLDLGGVGEESTIDSAGNATLGVISSFIYARSHDSATNRAFVKHHQEMFGAGPNWITVVIYDIMTAIYKAVEAQNGQVDPDKTIALIKGMKIESPRGPIAIDANRDIIQNLYITRVESRGGKPVNVEIETFPMVRNTFTSKN